MFRNAEKLCDIETKTVIDEDGTIGQASEKGGRNAGI